MTRQFSDLYFSPLAGIFWVKHWCSENLQVDLWRNAIAPSLKWQSTYICRSFENTGLWFVKEPSIALKCNQSQTTKPWWVYQLTFWPSSPNLCPPHDLQHRQKAFLWLRPKKCGEKLKFAFKIKKSERSLRLQSISASKRRTCPELGSPGQKLRFLAVNRGSTITFSKIFNNLSRNSRHRVNTSDKQEARRSL